MKVLISDKISEDGIEYLEKEEGLQVVNRPGLSPEQLLEEIHDARALIVRSKTRVTAQVIGAAPRLRCIGRAGAGVDNIDLTAATRQGIVVMNTPGGNSISVAEHTLALLLSLVRKVPRGDASIKRGEWKKAELTGSELSGKTLGILGLGKIGSIVARRARGFGMPILGYDPFVNERYAEDLEVELCGLDEALSRSDIVTLHLPDNDETKGLIDRRRLELMKPSAFLINAARGALVDEEDLARALENGRLAGAALDVFRDEPRVHPRLASSDKVVLTPHVAGSTVEAQSKVGLDIAVQTVDYLKREVIRNAVNFPSVSPHELEQLEPYMRLGERLGILAGRINQGRCHEIGIRYYGDLGRLNHKPVTNCVLKGVLRTALGDEVNEINARPLAEEREIEIVETVSSRTRSYTNLISIRLRGQRTEWVEGALLHQGRVHLVSIDGIPIEAPLGEHLLFVRNDDKPGVIGQVGTLLGSAGVNIASFTLGRGGKDRHAVGVVNVDSPIPKDVVDRIAEIPAVGFVRLIKTVRQSPFDVK